MTALIVGPNRLGIGLDIGWRTRLRDGSDWDVWWGNTRDETTLELLKADLSLNGREWSAELRLPNGKPVC